MSGYYAPPTHPGYAPPHQAAYGQPIQYPSQPNAFHPNTLHAQNPQQPAYGWNQTPNYQAYPQYQQPPSPVGPPNGSYGMQNAMGMSMGPPATANNRPLPLPSPGAPPLPPASVAYTPPSQFNQPVNNHQTGYFSNPAQAYPYQQQQQQQQAPLPPQSQAATPPVQSWQNADEAKRALYERARVATQYTARRSSTLPASSDWMAEEQAKQALHERAQAGTSIIQHAAPAAHQISPASPVQQQPASSKKWLSEEEEKQALYKKAKTAAELTQRKALAHEISPASPERQRALYEKAQRRASAHETPASQYGQQQQPMAHPVAAASPMQTGPPIDTSNWTQRMREAHALQAGTAPAMHMQSYAHQIPPQQSYNPYAHQAQYVPTGRVANLISGLQGQPQNPYGSQVQAAPFNASQSGQLQDEDVPPPPPPKSTSPPARSGTSPSGSGMTKRALPSSPSLPPSIPQGQGRQPSPFQHQSTQSMPTLSMLSMQNVAGSATPSPATPTGNPGPTKRSLPAAPGAGGITPGTPFSPPPTTARGIMSPGLPQTSSFQMPASPTSINYPSPSPNQTTPTSNSFPAQLGSMSNSSSTNALDNRTPTPSHDLPTSAPSSYASARTTFSVGGEPTNAPYSAPSNSPPPTGPPRSATSDGVGMAWHDTGGSASGGDDKRPLWKRMAAAAGAAGPIGSRPRSVFGQHRISASFSEDVLNSPTTENGDANKKEDVPNASDADEERKRWLAQMRTRNEQAAKSNRDRKSTVAEETQMDGHTRAGSIADESNRAPEPALSQTVQSPPPTIPPASIPSSLPPSSSSPTQPPSSAPATSSASGTSGASKRAPLPTNPSGSNIPLSLQGASTSHIPQMSQAARGRPIPMPPTNGVAPGQPGVSSQASTATSGAPPNSSPVQTPPVTAPQHPQQIRQIQTQPRGPDAKEGPPAASAAPVSTTPARTPVPVSSHSRTQSVPASVPTPPSRPQTTPLPAPIFERTDSSGSTSQVKSPIDTAPKPRVLQKKRPEEKTKQQSHSSFTTPRYQVPLKPAADEVPTKAAASASAGSSSSSAPPRRPASAGSSRTTANTSDNSGEPPQISMALRFASQDLVKQVKKDKDWAKWALVTGHQVATNPGPIDGNDRSERRKRSMSTGAVDRVDLDDEPPRPKSVVVGGERKIVEQGQGAPATYSGHERERSQGTPPPQQPIKNIHASSSTDGAVLVNTPNGMRRGGARPMPSSRPTSLHHSRTRSGSLGDSVGVEKDFPQYRPSFTDSDSDETNDGNKGSANRTITMSGPAPQISVTHHDAGSSAPNTRARSGSSPAPPPPVVVVPSIQIDGVDDDDDGPPAITITVDEPSSEPAPAPNVPVFSFSGPDDEPSASTPPPAQPSDGKEKKRKKLHKREKSVKEEEDERDRLRQLAKSRPLPPKIKKKTIRCGKCDKNIMGRVVTAMNARWHPECFRCTVCETFLEHVSSYEHDDRPYCHLDYHELFAPRCFHCKTPIMEEHFITLDDETLGKRTYHEQHFFCAECGDPFLAPKQQRRTKMLENGTIQILDQDDDVGFTVHKGHAYCEACHVRLRMPKCKRCKKSIRPGDQAIEAMGGKWCWSCFTCERCRKPFDDPQFYEHEKKPYCQPCYGIILVNQFD